MQNILCLVTLKYFNNYESTFLLWETKNEITCLPEVTNLKN